MRYFFLLRQKDYNKYSAIFLLFEKYFILSGVLDNPNDSYFKVSMLSQVM